MRRHRLIALAAAAALTAHAAAGSPLVNARRTGAVTDIGACDRAVADAPGAFSSYDCYRAYINATKDRATALQRLEALALTTPDRPWLTYTRAIVSRSPLDARRALFEQAVAEFRAAGDLAHASVSLAQLADVEVRYGRFDEARTHLEQAGELAAASSDPLAPLFVKIRRAKLEVSEAKFDQAWALCSDVLADPGFDELWVEFKLSALYMLANAEMRIGMSERAVARSRQAFALAEREGDAKHRLDASMQLMWAASSSALAGVMPREEALELALRLRPAVENASPFTRYQYLRSLARVAEGERRLEYVDELIELSRRLDHEVMLTSALSTKALVLGEDHPDRLREALELLREALSIERTAEDPTTVVGFYRLVAEINMRLGDRRLAVESALMAIEAVEARRVRVVDPVLSARFASSMAEIHYLLADFLLEQQPLPEPDLDLALAVVEQLRARKLILRDEREIDVPAERADEERAILRAISDVQLKLMFETDEHLRAGLRRELSRLESRELLRLGDLDRRPRVVPLSEFATTAGVRAVLPPDSALVYFVAMEGIPSHAIVIDDAGVRVTPLPDSARIKSAIGMWTGLLLGRDEYEPTFAASLGALLGGLFDERLLGRSRIFVSADGPYHRLPFEALVVGGERIGESRQFLYVPSATYFARSRSGRDDEASGTRSLVLADPRLNDTGGASGFRDALWSVASLGALPHARTEATIVSRKLGSGTSVRLGEAATESFLKTTDLSGYRLIHFAAHAVVNERMPNRSAVVLAPGPGEDGLLQERDIEGFRLGGSIVVLAACQSAHGETIQGEGVVSLANAFLRAGARAVIASRWSLRDDESSAFFSDFYESLARGDTVSEALRFSRAEGARRSEHAAAWAGVLAVGQRDASLPARRPAAWPAGRPLLAVAAALLIAGLAILLLRTRRRPSS